MERSTVQARMARLLPVLLAAPAAGLKLLGQPALAGLASASESARAADAAAPQLPQTQQDRQCGTEMQVLQAAQCGVVMMSWGKNYSEIAAQVAAHTRALPAFPGWCPLDESLDHVPVTLFTDVQPRLLGRCMPPGVRLQQIGIVPETSLEPWGNPAGNANLPAHLGSWRMRWYHTQAILKSPYTLTLYLDVDALACTATGISRMMWDMVQNHAYFGSSLVLTKRCHMSVNCSWPHPENLHPMEMAEWEKFVERNSGVIVADMRMARPIIRDWGEGVKRMAGQVKGDQYALREALFKHRTDIPQHLFDNEQICRYPRNHSLHNCAGKKKCKHAAGAAALTSQTLPALRCEGDGEGTCYVHHMPFFESIQTYHILNNHNAL